MKETWSWQGHPERVDQLLRVLGFAYALGTWLKERKSWQRLADVEVPSRIPIPLMLFSLSAKRERDRAWTEAGQSLNELGRTLATRMVEGDERQKELVVLQESVERYTKWLLVLTVVVTLVGIGSIAATIVVAATQ